MKSLRYILIAMMVVFATGCGDDFLDKKPLAKLSDATFLEDESTVDLAVNRLYGTLSWRFFRYGWMYFTTHEACSGDIKSGTQADYDWFKTFIQQNNHFYVELYWSRMYEYLNYCNVVLDITPKMNDREKAQLIEAQAKFFRAYYNFDLTNVFEDAVLRDHLPSPSEYNIPKSTREQLHALIIADLEYAIENLPTKSAWGAAGNGRITKGAAMGLLAKVYLFRQEYDKALEYTSQIIQSGEYSLHTSYRDVFSPDQRYGVENMMPGHYIFNTTVWSGRWFNPYLQHQGCAGEFGNGGFYPSDELAASYEDGDPRFAATLFTATDKVDGFKSKKGAAPDGSIVLPAGVNYLNKKVIWPVSYWNNGEFSFQNVNPMFMRYADILLIHAEASNEVGQTGDALAKLEMIRKRARGNKTFAQSVADGDNDGNGILPEITEADKSTLRKLIWDERHIELALEGHRWFDLVRYEKVEANYTTNLLVNEYGRTNFNYQKHHRFAIPATFVTSSQGVLLQHPEWQ
jgi:starch-binding outer membrane protein, SusD/RagB family